MTSPGHFARDYAGARRHFLDQAASAGLRVETLHHPSARGPAGEDLFIDVADAGPADARDGLLVISGTHGAEGYAGSAIQSAWLHANAAAAARTGHRLAFVHALNPSGFAWNRRVNEENVDLNRNFIDWSAPLPQNEGYDRLRNAINPPDLDTGTLEAASRAMRAFAKDHGAFALQEVISRGQYRHPAGMYYGGNREQWSAQALRSIVASRFAACRRLAVIDIHTGLGGYGDAELIIEDTPGSDQYRRAKAWWGDSVRSTLGGESVSAQVTGSIDAAIPSMVPPSCETTMICLEFGTLSTLEVFGSLRADNWLHAARRATSDERAAIVAQVRRAFFPDEPVWNQRVLDTGLRVIDGAVRALSAA